MDLTDVERMAAEVVQQREAESPAGALQAPASGPLHACKASKCLARIIVTLQPTTATSDQQDQQE